MVIPRKRHGIWWMSMPVPVAVALCVTCFFFGYFTHSAPRLGPSLQTQMLDASIRQKQQQQKRPQQKHQQTQTPLQPEVITPQQEQAELKQQQQQQQEQEQQHQQAAAAEQQKKEQRLKELHQQSLEQQQKKQQNETGVQQPQQQQPPPLEGQPVPQQPQPRSLPAEAQTQQPQPQTQQQQQQLGGAVSQPQTQQQLQQQQQQASAVSPAVDTADAERQAQACLQRAGLLQPLLPPAESGHNHYTIAAYQILSWQPRIVVYPNFIDRHKAANIINLAQHRAKRSEVKLRQGEELDPTKNVRTSAGVSLRREEDSDGVLGWLEDKIEAVTLIPASHGEPFYAWRYQLNEKHDSHIDQNDVKQNGGQKTVRLAKMIIYLSDVEEGGETVIEKEVVEGDLKKVSNYTTCEDGNFKYKPRLGDAVLFYSLDPDSSINPRSLHSGCPVMKGTKWVVTKWLHNKPVQKGATR